MIALEIISGKSGSFTLNYIIENEIKVSLPI